MRLEEMAANRNRYPLKHGSVLKNYKINRYDPTEQERSSQKTCGIRTAKQNDFDDLIHHNYLRKSMEQRVQKQALLESFKKMRSSMKNVSSKETLSSKLRSQSIQNRLKQTALKDNVYGLHQSSEYRMSSVKKSADQDSRVNDFSNFIDAVIGADPK